MKLTVEECRIAAECADQYPAGYGFMFVAVPFVRGTRQPFNSDETANWFKQRPEDIPKG